MPAHRCHGAVSLPVQLEHLVQGEPPGPLDLLLLRWQHCGRETAREALPAKGTSRPTWSRSGPSKVARKAHPQTRQVESS